MARKRTVPEDKRLRRYVRLSRLELAKRLAISSDSRDELIRQLEKAKLGVPKSGCLVVENDRLNDEIKKLGLRIDEWKRTNDQLQLENEELCKALADALSMMKDYEYELAGSVEETNIMSTVLRGMMRLEIKKPSRIRSSVVHTPYRKQDIEEVLTRLAGPVEEIPF